jgi:hypothetical protein
MSERIRWKIAAALDRFTSLCWADLVTWALGWHPIREVRSNRRGLCQNDLARNGACYCGKLRAGAAGDTE